MHSNPSFLSLALTASPPRTDGSKFDLSGDIKMVASLTFLVILNFNHTFWYTYNEEFISVEVDSSVYLVDFLHGSAKGLLFCSASKNTEGKQATPSAEQ